MRLRTKFVLSVGSALLLFFGALLYRTAAFQKKLAIDQALVQARMLHRQILLTRQWIADHNGLFFLKQPGVEANPFLDEPSVVDLRGQEYVKRNPAMVTRELSVYADLAGLFRYRVTTLAPINPENAPDQFERWGLTAFADGAAEVSAVESTTEGRQLRYMSPLQVEESCLDCHAKQGYRVGDVRGALSVTIPLERAFQEIRANNRTLLGYGLATVLAAGLVLFLLLEFLVVRRLAHLASGMERYPAPAWKQEKLPAGTDEVGRLSRQFTALCHRLDASREELDRTREQVFQNEKLAALGRLTAGIAHEINNPLGGMKNCLKSLAEEPENRELRERYLPLIGKGLERIAATVRQLLNFGRQQPLTPEPTDVDELLRDCFGLLAYGRKDIDIRLDLGLDGRRTIAAEGLRQVVINIGLNGIQAMAGGGVLTVSSESTTGGIRIAVADTGGGMDRETLSRIFDPFFTTKEVGQGTGLGLSVSHALVERMGGSIRVESEPGRGSSFLIELPVKPDIAESND